MCRKIFITQLAFLLPALLSYSMLSYAHGEEGNSQNHALDDMYLAEQARLRESGASYLVNDWQERLLGQLSQLNTRLLSEVIDSAFASGNPATDGEWSPNTTWPFAFASAANLPDGRILAWGANLINSFNGGNKTYAAIWDPANGSIIRVDNNTHSMFCGMPVMLEDGRVFVAGGDKASTSSVKMTSTFNFSTQSWTRIQDMHVGRWYNGSVALPNGKVFTAVGDPGSPYPELWASATGWDYLNGASLQTAILNFPTVTEPKNWLPHLHLAPNGKIFHSGHTPQMNYIDTDGNGSITPVSITNDFNGANASGALFDEGKLLQAGGSLYDAQNTSTTHTAIVDINTATPERTRIAEMNYPRIFHNQVILPNGEVMVIGGNTTGEKFSDKNLITGVSTSQLTPEIWSPFTQTWRTVAQHATPRNYHSVALLMTDGRVWSGGGGLCACYADHPDSAVYTPPYLFNANGTLATRPSIVNAPNIVSYGQTIDVIASSDVNRFTMVKMSSTTHATNSDMRFLNVQFTLGFDGHFNLTLHSNRNVMTPGYWMLFALNAQGVPSLAKVIKVSTSNSPVITVPADQSTIVGSDVAFPIVATDPNGDALAYDAVGLPLGLTINSTTGQISGIPSSTGSSRVVISASDGTNTATAAFVWTIVNDQSPPLASSTFGNNIGSPFSDTVNPDELLTGINIQSSGVLDGIQGVLSTGALPLHGGNTGTLTNVSWPITEYLVRINGVYGASIGKITFVTNTGRVLGPYGTASLGNNLSNFDYTVPAGREIVGFNGMAGAYVNSIGVMHRVRQLRNQPPVVTSIIDQQNKVGDAIQLAISANDPDSDVLIYSATGLPAELTIDPNTGVISGTITQITNNDVIVKVQDAKGGVSAINFNWTVSDSVITINPIATTPQAVNTTVNFTASVANGINPRYKWSFGDGIQTDYSTTAAISHTYSVPGLYVVKFTVIDDVGATNSNTLIQAIYLPHTAKSPTASTNILVDNGNRLWVVNQDNDTVSVFNADTNAKLGEITVGKAPRAVAQAPDGRIWVTNRQGASVSIIDPSTLTVVQTVALPFASQPYGLAFAPDDSAAYVVLEGAGKLLKLNPSTGVQLASLDVGANPRHLSVTADSGKVLVSRFITPPMPGEATASIDTSTKGGEVVVIDAAAMAINKTMTLQHSDLQDDTARGSGIPNYLAMPAIAPDGLSAWVPSKQDNIKRGTLRNGNNINFQNTVRGIASKINLSTLAEVYSERVDFDNSGIGSAAVFDRTGNYLFVALENTREVALVDAYAGSVLDRIDVGRAPDGLAMSSDGTKLYVNNFMDRTVSVVDITHTLSWGNWQPPVVAQFTASNQEKLAANVLAGKQYFYDAKDLRLARDGYLSCAVCHNDGGHDGRVWDLTGMGEGLRNTIALRGRSGAAGHGILHWSGNFDEVQDFEGQIRGLAAGTGLMTDADFAATSDTLGTPKAGKSSDLDELAAYLTSLNSFAESPQRNADGSLTADAVAGKALFTSAGCGQCHTGAPFTDSPAGLPHNNVGTIKPSSGKRLNGPLAAIDTPTLRDVWDTAPYLHDGSAATVDAAIRAHNTVTLTDAEIAKVAAYVQQIGSSEPAPDVTPPTVAITAPTVGVTVSGAGIAISADASDSDGVAGVQFRLDGNNLDVEDTTAPYSVTWNTTEATNAVHVLTAVARDTAGNISTSSPISVTVHNDTTAPTVAITAPTVGATVSGASVAISADASDSDGVAGVQFKLDGVNLGAEDTTSPYGITWDSNGVVNGTHSLTAIARDAAGNSATSSAITITVNNTVQQQLPDVIVTALTYSNGVFTSTVKNQGTAATPAGVVIGVGYLVDGDEKTWGAAVSSLAAGASVTVGSDGGAFTIPNGTHTITADVDDVNRFAELNETNNTLSQTITVGGSDTTPPTVSISAPANNGTVVDAAVAITATAADNVAVAGVQFKLDGVNLGAEDVTSPYSITWDSTTATNASHTLTAVARDTTGNATTSSAVIVTVNNSGATPLPDVVVTDLVYSNGVFTSTIKNQGTAATPVGKAIGVGYSVDGVYKTWGARSTSLAAGATATITTNGDAYTIPNGTHTITAKVDDVNRFAELDETNNSLTQTITVGSSDTTAPTVSITAPALNSTVTGAAVNIAATAADNVAVAGVQFKLDGANLGSEDTTAPYGISWDSTVVANAPHTITAVARDTSNNATTSTAVTVTVNNTTTDPTPPTVSVSAPIANSTVTGSEVNVTGTAADNVAVAGVQFKLDGINLGVEDTAAPYGITWDSTTVANGSHTLTAVARDTSNNATTSTAVTVTVNNSGVSLPDVVVTDFTYTNGVFTSTIKNQGTAATPAGVYVGVGYYVDGVYKTYGSVKGPLAVGASLTIGTNGSPYTIPSGTHTIIAHVDDVNRFAESDETNNKLTKSITQP